MTSPSKAKGSAWERECVKVLRGYRFGEAADRMPAGATDDRGDIAGIAGLVVECKNHANLATALRDGVDGLDAKREAAQAEHAVAFVKRKGKPADDGYAVMPIAQWCAMYDELRRAQTILELRGGVL